jgi:LPXTG-motif cell wall-anchored protein
MKKVRAGLIVAGIAAFGSLGLASPALAYPDNPPSSDVTPVQVNSAAPDSQAAAAATSSELPGTGGPNAVLLGGGAALVVAGGAVVVVARRRQTA